MPRSTVEQSGVASPAAPPEKANAARTSLLVLAVVAAVCAFTFRLVTYSGFSNDHFVHLSRAQAMLAGDLPLRDYMEEGVPLTVAISAGAQRLLGEGPFAELMLVLVSFSVAAALTSYAAGRLTGSAPLGFFAALLQIAALPSFYSHPKILLYPILFLMGWAYLQRPDGKRLAALGVFTGIAFLLRHDHGVYCAIGAGTAVVLAHWREGLPTVTRQTTRLAGICLICVAPYLAYVQYERGLVEYFSVGVTISRGEAGRADLKWPSVQHVRRGPLVTVGPRPIGSLAPIAIRWRDGLPEAERQRHERALGLLYGERRDDGRSWRYWIDPSSDGTLSAIVHLPDAVDTSGFDRRTLRFEEAPSWLRRSVSMLRLDRLRPGPPLQDMFSETNATAIVFTTLWALPAVALIVWMIRRRSCLPPLDCGPEIPLLAVITLVTTITLVREPSAYRIADGMGTAPILGAWVIAAFRAQSTPAFLRSSVRIAVTIFAAAFATATLAMAQTEERLEETGALDVSGSLIARVRETIHETRTWPWRRAWPQGSGIDLIPYLNRCTVEGDRLLITWNAPEFNVFSRRPFAGGETLLVPVFRPPETYEPAVLARLQRQLIPIVLTDVDRFPIFQRAYPRITDYLSRRYRQAGEVALDGQRIALLADRERMPSGVDPEFGLPCFARR